MSGESIPKNGDCWCKGPVVGVSETSKGNVGGKKDMREFYKMKQKVYGGPGHTGPSRP